MSPLERLVHDALENPFAAAQAHVHGGGRAIGYFGSDVPVELIIAAGAFPFRLPSTAAGSVALADRYLESSFAPDVRSIAQQYLDGRFDFLDAVILPRSNDSAQRLYYYLCELRKRESLGGPDMLIFDLAKIPRDISRAHSRAATQRLAAQIGVVHEALPRAIERRNRRRDLFARLAASRRVPAGPAGSTVDRLARAADRCDAPTFDEALEASLAGLAPGPSGPRLVLAGSAPPDERLHAMVEGAGGNVVAESGDHSAATVAQPPIAADGGLSAIADHYHAQQSGPRAFVDHAALITALSAAVHADGVILWLTEQEDALIWNLPGERSALAAAGTPSLALSRRRWDGIDARQEIEDFTQSLEGRP
jgi:benzoyl-CoA reductase/2-hydroxyglutaryl-CoA dehydratase subunit BcrC/BadD/HgdB